MRDNTRGGTGEVALASSMGESKHFSIPMPNSFQEWPQFQKMMQEDEPAAIQSVASFSNERSHLSGIEEAANRSPFLSPPQRKGDQRKVLSKISASGLGR